MTGPTGKQATVRFLEEVAVQQQTLSQRRELLRALATKVTLGRVVIKLDRLERLEEGEGVEYVRCILHDAKRRSGA